jgi:hypothetical protein
MEGPSEQVWLELQTKALSPSLKNPSERLLRQAGADADDGWVLSEEQLDVAAYEQLLLSLPPQHLPAHEVDTLDYIRTKLGYTSRQHREIVFGITLGADRDAQLEGDAGQNFEPVGYLDKTGAGGKLKGGKYKKRWFVLEGATLSYFEKPDGKPSGVVDLSTATGCEPVGASSPCEFSVNCPDRKCDSH